MSAIFLHVENGAGSIVCRRFGEEATTSVPRCQAAVCPVGPGEGGLPGWAPLITVLVSSDQCRRPSPRGPAPATAPLPREEASQLFRKPREPGVV